MKATKLVAQLDKDFIFLQMHDDFAQYIPNLHPYMTESFKQSSMGLVCDFTDEINMIYTAVFPSDRVMEQVFAEKPHNAMLFLHHPSCWELREDKLFWYQMSEKWVKQCQQHGVSIYAIHVPLDNFSEYSTSKTLADALGLEIIEPFLEYGGGFAGVIGKTTHNTVQTLSDAFSLAVGHATKLYAYGNAEIAGEKVAVIAGGGSDHAFLHTVAEKGVNTLVTGITVELDTHIKTAVAHQYAREQGINILGGTHYSTEKFACQRMCDYFAKLGLVARFMEDKSTMKDM